MFGLEESHYCPTFSFSGSQNTEVAALRARVESLEGALREMVNAADKLRADLPVVLRDMGAVGLEITPFEPLERARRALAAEARLERASGRGE